MIKEELFKYQDEKFKTFLESLIPNVDGLEIIGVKNPIIKSIAKQLNVNNPEVQSFIENLPHRYHEENKLHAYLIAEEKHDLCLLIKHIDEFIPYINNWETCDILTPKLFLTNKSIVHDKCMDWLNSKYIYGIRFGIVTAKRLFVNPISMDIYNKIISLNTSEYYLEKAIAWYLQECTIYNKELILNLLASKRLSKNVQNYTISKIWDSLRIDKMVKEQCLLLRKK